VRAWFGGQRGMNNLNATDRLGTSINSYQWNYINRLGGQAAKDAGGDVPNTGSRIKLASLSPTGTMSDVPPPGLIPSLPVDAADDNADQETPTDIPPAPSPVRVAQAGGAPPPLGGITPGSFGNTTGGGGPLLGGPAPGAISPTAVAPVVTQQTQAPTVALGTPPVMPTPPPLTKQSDEELRALQVLNSPAAQDPDIKEAYTRLYNNEVRKRTEADARNAEVFRADVARTEALARLYDERKAKAKELQLGLDTQAADLRAKLRQENVEQAFGNLPGHVVADLTKRQASAQTAVDAITAMNNAKLAMDSGTIFGLGADAKLLYYRARAFAGDQDAARIVASTENFKNNLAPLALKMIHGVGGSQISNEDRRVGTQMAGSDITQNRQSAERLIEIASRAAQNEINIHRAYLNMALQGQPARLKSMFDVQEPLPGIPFRGPAPQDQQAIDWARANPNDPRSRKILQQNGVQ